MSCARAANRHRSVRACMRRTNNDSDVIRVNKEIDKSVRGELHQQKRSKKSNPYLEVLFSHIPDVRHTDLDWVN